MWNSSSYLPSFNTMLLGWIVLLFKKSEYGIRCVRICTIDIIGTRIRDYVSEPKYQLNKLSKI